ncbi:transferase family protein [Emericellopsis atlantica]|uniref:Transferase family protein n=1 Tax=Emericellopsis atlantica TaxID=2614577 RepID=A0A9P7ZCQ6_9HYPO|nr:transferase family protein [Emericellopsis atlantica]KAG9249491.1 transferase family protein [Emericellopsis atlantica]
MEDFLRQLEHHSFELSPLDIIPSHLYLTKVFFYKGNLMSNDTLLASLYDSLQSFPILVAKLQRHGSTSMRLIVDRDAPNLPSWEEHEDLNVHFEELERKRFHRDQWPDCINITDPLLYAGNGGDVPKLLRVRLYRYRDSSGSALVVRVAHCVFDAKGFAFFMNHWATSHRNRLSSGAHESPFRPDLDRAVMYKHVPPDVRPQPLGRIMTWVSYVLTALLGIVTWFVAKKTSTGPSVSHLFRVPRESLDRVSSTHQGKLALSDNDIITALFLMSYAQLGRFSGWRLPKDITAIVPCDFRHRLGVPESFTGSCAVGIYVEAPLNLLLQPITPSSLSAVAAISREAVSKVDVHVITSLAKKATKAMQVLGDKARLLYSLMVCQAFSNQSRLPFYEIDFGAGGPLFVAPMAYSKSLAVIVPSPPGSEDVYVYLTLEEREMNRILQNEGFMSMVKLYY